jgi:hypothetical protein
VKRLFFVLLSCLAILYACAPSRYNVLKVEKSSYSKKNGFFYYLPKAVIAIDVVVLKTSHVPGPFQEYAEQYIGYSGIQKRSTFYEIESVVLNTSYEPDPSQLYYVELDDKQKVYVELEENGLMRKVNLRSSEEENQQISQDKKVQQVEKAEKEKLMTLLNLREKIDTIYSRQILEDSVVVETTQINKVLIKNSMDESAKEAAQRIADIRSNKFRLITFNDEMAFDAGALNRMIDELDQMELEYFKLFLGYSQVEKLKYTFYFVPDVSQKGYQPVFKFSPNAGVSDSLKLMMETVYIIQENAGKSNPTKEFIENSIQQQKGNNHNQGFAYRIPEQVSYQLVLNNKTLASATLLIPQFGALHRLPGTNLEQQWQPPHIRHQFRRRRLTGTRIRYPLGLSCSRPSPISCNYNHSRPECMAGV